MFSFHRNLDRWAGRLITVCLLGTICWGCAEPKPPPSNIPEPVLEKITAAEAGDPAAQYDLAQMYAVGQGITPDLEKARYWYNESAKQGNPYAQYSLGYMYETGQGVEANEAMAVQMYKSAAQRGYANAQYRLGMMLFHGRGGNRDLVEAYKWMTLASMHGNRNARFQVSKIGAVMSSEQISEAKRRLSQWRSS